MIDVQEIMREIKERATQRRMAQDLEMLDKMDIRTFKVDESAECVSVDDDCYIGNHFYFINSHRKGLMGRMANFVLRKFYFAMKVFLSDMISAQERFNLKIKRRLNKVDSDFAKFRNKAIFASEPDKGGIPNLGLDYLEFENRFRGRERNISDKQRLYLKYFRNCRKVLDMGCGRGEFIEMLSEVFAEGFGVEIDAKMADLCEKKGLKIFREDILNFLERTKLADEAVDGIFSAQVIEHLPIDYIIETLRLCYEILEDDRFIILETINIKSLSTFSNSLFKDPTHKTPMHPDTLKFILEMIGFRDVSFVFSSEYEEKEKLAYLDENIPGAKVYNENISKLNELLFAPQDYAVIGKK